MPRNTKLDTGILENEMHIPTVLDRTSCTKHGAEVGTACWPIYSEKEGGPVLAAICDTRAKKAGFVGEIDPASLGYGRVES